MSPDLAYGISEVDRRRAARQGDQLALREAEHSDPLEHLGAWCCRGLLGSWAPPVGDSPSGQCSRACHCAASVMNGTRHCPVAIQWAATPRSALVPALSGVRIWIFDVWPNGPITPVHAMTAVAVSAWAAPKMGSWKRWQAAPGARQCSKPERLANALGYVRHDGAGRPMIGEPLERHVPGLHLAPSD